MCTDDYRIRPLRWLLSLKTPTGWLARWALTLQALDIEVQYIPGRSNIIADILSRLPESEDDAETIGALDVCGTSIDLPRRSAAETRAERLKDDDIKAIIDTFEESATKEEYTLHTSKGYIMSEGCFIVLFQILSVNTCSSSYPGTSGKQYSGSTMIAPRQDTMVRTARSPV